MKQMLRILAWTMCATPFELPPKISQKTYISTNFINVPIWEADFDQDEGITDSFLKISQHLWPFAP